MFSEPEDICKLSTCRVSDLLTERQHAYGCGLGVRTYCMRAGRGVSKRLVIGQQQRLAYSCSRHFPPHCWDSAVSLIRIFLINDLERLYHCSMPCNIKNHASNQQASGNTKSWVLDKATELQMPAAYKRHSRSQQ